MQCIMRCIMVASILFLKVIWSPLRALYHGGLLSTVEILCGRERFSAFNLDLPPRRLRFFVVQGCDLR
jgi:hypothetical protein